MARFVVGDDRSQSTLFPERLDDYWGEDNPVRTVDVFADSFPELRGYKTRRPFGPDLCYPRSPPSTVVAAPPCVPCRSRGPRSLDGHHPSVGKQADPRRDQSTAIAEGAFRCCALSCSDRLGSGLIEGHYVDGRCPGRQAEDRCKDPNTHSTFRHSELNSIR